METRLGPGAVGQAAPDADDPAALRAKLDAALEREAALRRSAEELTDFFENASVGLHWVGPDGTILWANQSELDLLGYTREEYVGHHIAEFHADQPVIEDILGRLTRDETLRNYEARLRCKDGSVRHVLINSNVLWEDGSFRHTRCFTRDVTDLRRSAQEREELLERERAARERAEAALRTRDDFLSIAAHELKTPVTSLRLAAEAMLRRLDRQGDLDPARVRQSLELVDEQSVKLSRLVSQLLDVSRLESGGLTLEPQPTDLAVLVRAAAATAQKDAPRHTITVEATEGLVADVDELRVEQIVANLLDNAVRYSPDGGAVRVELRVAVAGAVEVAVTDRGLGIPREQRDRLFERFHQAHAVEHRSGLGLSLHISRRLAELHGGTLRAEFPAEGGCRFVLALPVGGSL